MGTRHFECRTFDLSDNSPYTSSVIPAPEECKKNTQERYEIVKSEPAQSPVRRTFSADETAGASKNFETFLRNGLSWKMGENSPLFWKSKRLDKAGFLRRFYPQSRMKSSGFESFAEMAQNGGKKAKWREFGKKGEKKERISALEV